MLALKPFRDAAAGVADLMPWATLMADGVIINKDGSLISGWFFRGPDVASSTPEERNHITRRINAALSQLGDGWAVWFEAARMPAASYPALSASHFPDPITALIDEERRTQFLAEGAHFETEHALAVMYTPPLRRNTRILDVIYDDDGTEKTPPSERQIETFARVTAALEDALGDILRLRRMRGFDYADRLGRQHHQDELVNFLHFCVTGVPAGLNIPPCAMHLDAIIGGQELWPGDTPRLGDKFIACVGIEGFPAESFPFILDLLVDQPFAYRFSSRLIPLDAHAARAELARYRRKWTQRIRGFIQQIFRTQGGVINEDAVLMARQTESAISDAHSGLVAFGYYTPVIVLMGEERAVLADQARQLAREIGRLGFAARIETINTMEAWLGSLPGQVYANVRRPLVHSLNFADLAPVTARFTGLVCNPSPMFPEDSAPLLHGATVGATPFRLNLHVSDVGHTLIFGPTGAGKSVLLATIAAQFRRYEGARVTVFDKGMSMFALAKAAGGAHYALADEGSPGLCPLAFLDEPSDAAWAEEWLAAAYEMQTDRQPTPRQKQEIHRAIALMRQTGRDESRSLTDFLTQVQDEEIRAALAAYTIDGPLGELLDARRDGLGDHSFTVFELEELMGLRERNLIPVLLYLFRRFEKSLTGTPALLILDEAWIMLGHPAFREKIREWLKTLRKANCAVVMATQSLSDAVRSGLFDVLIESCPTKILLPNAEAHKSGTGEVLGPRDIYALFGLNDAEIDIVAGAIPKRDYYYSSPVGRRLFELNLGPIARAFTAVSAREDVARIKALIAAKGEAWPFAWLERQGVKHEQAA